jgi:hypothetical protein
VASFLARPPLDTPGGYADRAREKALANGL